MKRNRDAEHLVKLANPVPDPEVMSAAPASASAQAVLEDIMDMNHIAPGSAPRRRRTTLLLTAALVVLGATAAWAYSLSGVFSQPAFSGETWKLTVGEEANGDTGTYKVCHSFEPRVGANMVNGLGVAGCGDWPSKNHASIMIDVVPAVHTEAGTVIFVDLTTEQVATVAVAPDKGAAVEVQPYRMPQSGKQYAVAELPSSATGATVSLLDNSGDVIEKRKIDDLSVPEQR